MTLNPPTRSPGRGRTYGAKMIGWEGRFYKEVAPLELQNRVSAGIISSRFGEHLASWGFSGRQDGARALPLGGQVARPNGRVARSTRTCPAGLPACPGRLFFAVEADDADVGGAGAQEGGVVTLRERTIHRGHFHVKRGAAYGAVTGDLIGHLGIDANLGDLRGVSKRNIVLGAIDSIGAGPHFDQLFRRSFVHPGKTLQRVGVGGVDVQLAG